MLARVKIFNGSQLMFYINMKIFFIFYNKYTIFTTSIISICAQRIENMRGVIKKTPTSDSILEGRFGKEGY